MGVTVITGHRLEALFDALCERLRAAPPRPMETETILVPALGVARWLELRLADRLGIAAGFEMPFLGAWLHRLTAPSGGLDADPFGKDVLAWRIWRLLTERAGEAAPERRFGAASDYVQDDPDGRKRLQLCQRISACLDDYQLYRDDLLEAFACGQTPGDVSPHAAWQAQLWRALLEDAGLQTAPPRERRTTADDGVTPLAFHQLRGLDQPSDCRSAHRVALLRARLEDSEWRARNLPARLHVFGTTTTPPAFMDLLHRVGRDRDVTVFVPQPTPHYFGDLREKRDRIGDHGLLARFGTESRDFQTLLVDLEERGHAEAPVTQETLDELEDRAEPGVTSGETVLACLQRDLVQAFDRGSQDAEPYALRGDDHSLRIHDCHSPQRELEVVRDQICAALDADATLRPQDVMVLVPDVERYAPYAHAVFGPLQKQLPFHLADRHPASELPVCRAALHVLALARTRLTVAEVLQLLELSAVQRRFRIFGGEVGLLRHLCQAAGVRWGLDAEQRSARFELPAFEDNSWRQGLDRLLLGHLTGPVDDLVCGYAPVGDTTEGRAELLARFAQFLEALFGLLEPLRAPLPLEARADQLDALVAALFAPEDPAEEDAVRQLRRAAVSLRTQAAAAGHTEAVELPVFTSWLDHALGQGSAARGGADRGFLGGAITFAGMLPMRAVPVRALFVCGLDDASFPRRDAPPPFDLISSRSRPGDRSRRLDDRQLFLDLLLAARERLHLTYVGRSAKDNSDCSPSVVVSELLEHVERTCGKGAAKQLLVRHPLQPWSPRYRDGDPKLFTYAAQPAIGGDDSPEQPWCQPGEPLLPDARTQHVRLDDLVKFWSAPCKAFLERGLRLRVRSADDPDDDREPFELTGLTRYALQDDAVRRAQRGEPERDDPLAWARARGVLPIGAQGDVAYDAALASAAPMLEEARRFAASAVRRVDVQVGETQVTGELDGLGEDARTAMRASKLKPKDRLRGWLQHLVLSLQRDQAQDARLPWPNRTRLLAADGTHVFRPVDPEVAEAHLSRLIELYFEGLTRPLAFFENSSFEVGAGPHKAKPAAALLATARKEYEGKDDKHSYGADLDDPAVALCMRGRDPIDEGVDGELMRLAEEVWAPLLEHLEEVER